MRYLPLRVEWTLTGPWCPPAYAIHLDGLVASAVVTRKIGADVADDAAFDELQSDLPFEREGEVWKASILRPKRILHAERRLMTCRTPELLLSDLSEAGKLEGRRLTKIDTVRGPMKNAAFYSTAQTVDGLVAWCVADPDALADLLGDIKSIGKRRRLGFGQVAVDGLSIVEDPIANELWKRRNLPEQPKDTRDTYVEVINRLAPPYWRADGRRVVWMPL